MLSAVNLDKTYHDLSDMIACDRNSNVCMINRCKSCPGINKVEKKLQEHFQLTGEPQKVSSNEHESRTHDFDEEEEESTITFKQWVTTDQSKLFSQAMTISDYIGTLCEKLDAITAHSAFVHSQVTGKIFN